MSSKTNTTTPKPDGKPALVPKLRFPEFRDAEGWEEKSLAQICHLITNGKANAQDHEEAGEYPLFDRSAVIKRSSEFMFDGEAVILPGEGMRFVPKFFRGKFNLHQRAYALMEHQGDARFVYHSLDYLQDSLAKRAVKSTVLSLRLPIVENFVIGCPNPPEQKKIAECLSSMDELIAAQARKLDALKTHKKGLMQQLFPREGETQPRLRFPEFRNAGEWVETSLGGVARLRNGYAFKSSEYVDEGPYQIITIANVQQGTLAIEITKRIAALPSDIQQHQVLYLGDILISMTGNVGRVCRVTAEGLLLNQRVGKLTPAAINDAFFYQLLQRDEFRNTMQLKAAGGAQGNLSGGDITEYGFNMPTEPKEQKCIADCLASLDDLIAAQAQKLDALKTHKKGLMQLLFPSPEAVEA